MLNASDNFKSNQTNESFHDGKCFDKAFSIFNVYLFLL